MADSLDYNCLLAAGLLADEARVLELLNDFWTALVFLPVINEADVPEAILHVHALQDLLLSRPVRRRLSLPARERPDWPAHPATAATVR
jgi:hypothetical protein